MKAQQFNKVMIGFLVLMSLGLIAMLYVGNMLMQKSAVKLVNAKLDGIGYDAQEQTYLRARKDLDKYSDINETIQKILPKTKDQAQAVSELYKIGDETDIVIERIQFPTSTLGQKKTSSVSPSATKTTATTSQTATQAITQAKAVDGMPGVMGIDISINLLPAKGLSIPYDNMISFLQKVESNRRNMQIKQISVNTDTENGGIAFNVTLTIFVKP